MQTHSWHDAVGYFLTALALGAGWAAGSAIMTQVIGLLQRIGQKSSK